MSIAQPLPLGEATLKAVSDSVGVPIEEAIYLENYRRFFGAVSSYHELDENYRNDEIIEENSQKIKISIVKPKNHGDQVLPVILYTHGGGWIACDYLFYNKQLHEMANRANAYIVFPHYSLSPEVKYPVALEECYTTLQWIQKHGESRKFDTSRLAVAGDSAGGNLAAALTILCKQRNNKGIKQQVLFYPATDNNFETESHKLYKHDDVINGDTIEYMWNSYVRDENDFNLPLVTPLKASINDLKGLPPTLVITAEIDVLNTEGELFANKLQKAEVETLSVRYDGVQHGFVTFAARKISAEGIQALQQSSEWLKGHWSV